MSSHLSFDHLGTAPLDGTWDFFAGDHDPESLRALEPQPIRVPALWEAEGHLDLDGIAWYRRTFRLDNVAGFWTLGFGSVMDTADVYLNGVHLGSHDSPFTPFRFDVTRALAEGENELLVRVFDPPVDDPAHIRSPHGKQGWANWVFPSRPSLYMTYGGIWQPVRLRRHGPVTIENVFVNSDPDDLVVAVEVENRSDAEQRIALTVRTLGVPTTTTVALAPRATETVEAKLGRTSADRWQPERPVLHDVLVDAVIDGVPSDTRRDRFGLRTVRIEGGTLLINETPYRMKSALVQGFRADGLYAEGPRAEIEREVLAARAMGFNTLRLHIKAFDPLYLDVCDELGMLLHCDIPIAEPIAHEEMGEDTELAQRCIRAARAQVRRDRNHPSVIMWSAMNELCFDRMEARAWEEYELFARAVYRAVAEVDSTRPIIENDWAEPDPERVFESPILTAHWYGRLHADYLAELEERCARWRDAEKPLYVTEFGDWGLPDMPRLEDPPFWDTHDVYAAGLAATLWPATVARFVTETQRYQGLSDRMQIEVFRRHGHVGGYCLTELTDVPHELNGLLDLHRNPKPIAVREVTRANQVVLPMLALETLVMETGQLVRARLHVANDGPPLEDVEVEIRFGDAARAIGPERLAAIDGSALSPARAMARFDESSWAMRIPRLEGYAPTDLVEVLLFAPDVPGGHDLILRLRSRGVEIAENRYPVHLVDPPPPLGPMQPAAAPETEELLRSLGAQPNGTGPLLIDENVLPQHAGAVRDRLARGGAVIVLAQPTEAAGSYPVPVTLDPVATAWGSSVFHFTTDAGVIGSLPRRNVLVAEDSTIQARTMITAIGGAPFPDESAVVAYKPSPGATTGTIVGAHAVGAGRMLFCQYRLVAPAARGDTAARAVLADLVRWASHPEPTIRKRPAVMPDGKRAITYYEGGAR